MKEFLRAHEVKKIWFGQRKGWNISDLLKLQQKIRYLINVIFKISLYSRILVVKNGLNFIFIEPILSNIKNHELLRKTLDISSISDAWKNGLAQKFDNKVLEIINGKTWSSYGFPWYIIDNKKNKKDIYNFR